ncbi:MAG: hypothetical protein WDO73_35040 [Ignavibacteriota bacterium]
MTIARVLDTQRLSTLAHEYEREILRFFSDLSAEGVGIERIRREAEKVQFDEIRPCATDQLLMRIGTGKYVILMDAQSDPTGVAGMIYAGKLINELGMYDEFTLWVATSLRQEYRGQAWFQSLKEGGIRPDCVLLAEPTSWSIRMREAAVEGFLHEADPLVQAAISTYEALFELPPILNQAPSPAGPLGVPIIGFGPGGDHTRVPTHHLLKAAQFYAAFPTMFAESMRSQMRP